MTGKFIREKQIFCGSEYKEVDIFGLTGIQVKAVRGKRSKRKKESEPKQKNLNDKNAKRYFTQLVEMNFGQGKNALHISCTYNEKYLPKSLKEAEKFGSNYLRRIAYKRKKEGLPPLEYISIISWTDGADGTPKRIHHHIIINGGLDRDEVEDMWRMRKKKGQEKGDLIGYVNADRVQPDENGISALANYLCRQAKGKKRWTSSHNLKRPSSRENDNRYSVRQIDRLIRSGDVYDVSYWEKKYPGWTIKDTLYGIKCEVNNVTGIQSIYLKLRRKRC